MPRVGRLPGGSDVEHDCTIYLGSATVPREEKARFRIRQDAADEAASYGAEKMVPCR